MPLHASRGHRIVIGHLYWPAWHSSLCSWLLRTYCKYFPMWLCRALDYWPLTSWRKNLKSSWSPQTLIDIVIECAKIHRQAQWLNPKNATVAWLAMFCSNIRGEKQWINFDLFKLASHWCDIWTNFSQVEVSEVEKWKRQKFSFGGPHKECPERLIHSVLSTARCLFVLKVLLKIKY